MTEIISFGMSCLIIGDIGFKIDPKTCNLINKSTIEKQLFDNKQVLNALLIIFFLDIVVGELDDITPTIDAGLWGEMLYSWLTLACLVYFATAYFYYNTLYHILLTFNFNSLKYLPTLNIHKILPSEYFLAVAIAYGLMGGLLSSDDIVELYIAFELTNINTYCILGIVQGSPKAAESAVRYYFISFLSSLFCLWGATYIYGSVGFTDYTMLKAYMYNLTSFEYNNSIILLLGISFIILSFFIKLGIFPCHMWIPIVYESTLNFTFLFLMTLSKLGFYFGMLEFIYNLIISTCFALPVFQDIFCVCSVGSAFAGSCLLLTRGGSIKGFLIANSIITWGILMLGVATCCQISSWENEIDNLSWNLQYIIIYINILFVIWNVWLNWYLYIYWSKLLKYFYYRNNWMVVLIVKFFKTSAPYWDHYSKPGVSPTFHINYLTTLYYIFKEYDDTVSVLFIWVVAGFPPFMLFITKFYMASFAWYHGLDACTFLTWFIINTLGVYGYIKGMSFMIIRYYKEVYETP